MLKNRSDIMKISIVFAGAFFVSAIVSFVFAWLLSFPFTYSGHSGSFAAVEFASNFFFGSLVIFLASVFLFRPYIFSVLMSVSSFLVFCYVWHQSLNWFYMANLVAVTAGAWMTAVIVARRGPLAKTGDWGFLRTKGLDP